MKHTTLISESEKKRILNLHENVIREEFNLIMEQSSEELKKFFEDQKTKFRNFPEGTIIPYNSGIYEFGYEVKNADGSKYILIPDGTAAVDNGTGYKVQPNYTWTKNEYSYKMPTKPLQSIQLSTDKLTDLKPNLNPVSFDNLATDSELKKLNRITNKTERIDNRQQLKNSKTKVKQCMTAFNNYIKFNLGSKKGSKDELQYSNFLKTNCAGLDEINLASLGL
jgi:hypothetical protein